MDKVIFKPKILIRKSKIGKIAKSIGCCDAAVYNAITFRTNSDLAVDIRNVACNKYGGILVKKFPELVEDKL